ncbi:conserved phage C-terminal domain-containing protein [Clostridium sp.]|uniref:conserved phage C-terminal domain-containing protein n=1 Tax=Clostridium sp. TaxID=1506 RepID=UPI003F40D617
MKNKLMYNILGFKQAELVNLKLDLNDTLIINYISNFIKSGKMVTEKVNGEEFYWVDYKSLLESLPILNLKKDALYKRLKALEKKEILKHYTKKSEGTYSFYALGDKYEDLLYKNTNHSGKISSEVKENKLHGGGEKSGTKDSELEDSFNNDSVVKEMDIELVKEVIRYLNYMTRSEFSYDNKNYINLIKRWALEGYTREDFKKVINRKSSEWGSTEFSKYLRPETLFGDKFYKYINEKFKVNGFNNFEPRDYDYERLERQLLGWEDKD